MRPGDLNMVVGNFPLVVIWTRSMSYTFFMQEHCKTDCKCKLNILYSTEIRNVKGHWIARCWLTIFVVSPLFPALLFCCSLSSPFVSFWASQLSHFWMLNHRLCLPFVSWGLCVHCLMQLAGNLQEIPGKSSVAWCSAVLSWCTMYMMIEYC